MLLDFELIWNLKMTCIIALIYFQLSSCVYYTFLIQGEIKTVLFQLINTI